MDRLKVLVEIHLVDQRKVPVEIHLVVLRKDLVGIRVVTLVAADFGEIAVGWGTVVADSETGFHCSIEQIEIVVVGTVAVVIADGIEVAAGLAGNVGSCVEIRQRVVGVFAGIHLAVAGVVAEEL